MTHAAIDARVAGVQIELLLPVNQLSDPGHRHRLGDRTHVERDGLANLLPGGEFDSLPLLRLESAGFDPQPIGADGQKVEAELTGRVLRLLLTAPVPALRNVATAPGMGAPDESVKTP
jgi:hypothetical protein